LRPRKIEDVAAGAGIAGLNFGRELFASSDFYILDSMATEDSASR